MYVVLTMPQRSLTHVKVNSSSSTAEQQLDGHFVGSLAAERSQSTLDAKSIRQITTLLDEDDERITALKDYTQRVLERDPVYSQIDNYDKTLPEMRVISMQKAKKGHVFWQNILNELHRLGLSQKLEIAQRHAWGLFAISDPGTTTRLGVHSGLFTNAIKGQGHDSLRDKVLPLSTTLQIFGCFAMTEKGHGMYYSANCHKDIY
jgi:acyl-CoA oxidase